MLTIYQGLAGLAIGLVLVAGAELAGKRFGRDLAGYCVLLSTIFIGCLYHLLLFIFDLNVEQSSRWPYSGAIVILLAVILLYLPLNFWLAARTKNAGVEGILGATSQAHNVPTQYPTEHPRVSKGLKNANPYLSQDEQGNQL